MNLISVPYEPYLILYVIASVWGVVLYLRRKKRGELPRRRSTWNRFAMWLFLLIPVGMALFGVPKVILNLQMPVAMLMLGHGGGMWTIPTIPFFRRKIKRARRMRSVFFSLLLTIVLVFLMLFIWERDPITEPHALRAKYIIFTVCFLLQTIPFIEAIRTWRQMRATGDMARGSG